MKTFSGNWYMARRRAAGFLLAALFALAVPLAAAEGDDSTPLAKRVLGADGDMKLVPIWKWFNDLTGDNAAVILLSPDDLGRFELHRSWKKGQTIGEVVRNVEKHLGRFRVHFEDDSVSLLSLSAEEVINLPENREGYPAWTTIGDASVVRLVVFGTVEFRDFSTMSGGTCALETSYVFTPALEGYLRADWYPMGGESRNENTFAWFAGSRWTPFADWDVAPYVQAGGGYSKYDSAGGFGFFGGIGCRIGSNADSSFVLDYTAIKLPGMLLGQFRIGFMFGL